MPQSYVKRILDARVYDVARETPVDKAYLMSRRLDNEVWLKREDLQEIADESTPFGRAVKTILTGPEVGLPKP